jgi:hypothetical protein
MSKMNKVAAKFFNTNLVLEYSMTPTPTQLGNANNTMELYISDDGKKGSISWEYELEDGEGDEVGIGLWFAEGDKVLTDYDGVFELPKQAIELLEENGYNADYAK